MDDKVDQLVPIHLFSVEVGNQKTDVVALKQDTFYILTEGPKSKFSVNPYLNLLSSENDKVFRPPHHESHELVTEQSLNLVGLFDGNGHSDGVDRGLDQNSLLLIPKKSNKC